MPIRIKPEQELQPCLLTLESIQGITDLVTREFPQATYSAYDGSWEAYNETRDGLLDAISGRDSLDSFVGQGEDGSSNEPRKIEVTFNDREAKVNCVASPQHQNWFEHFMIGLKKHVLPATFAQRWVGVPGEKSWFNVMLGTVFFGFSYESRAPYCTITLRKKPPNRLVENIQANLVSNLIWVVIGAIVLLFIQWVFRTFGVDLNPFD